MCVYTVDVYDSCSHRSGHIYHEIQVKYHSSANSLQVAYFLIRRATKKMTCTADLRKKYACMWMCVYTVDVYDSCSHRSGHIYHEIQVKYHSSANSLQVAYFLIRRATKKMTCTADLRKKYACLWMRVYTVDVYDSCSHRSGNIYHEIQVKYHSSASSLQVAYFLIRRATKKWRLGLQLICAKKCVFVNVCVYCRCIWFMQSSFWAYLSRNSGKISQLCE